MDPFGRTRLRRIEARLPNEYRDALEAATRSLKPETLEDAIELAGLPDIVRGYEDIKLARVAEFRQRLGEVLGRLITD